MKLTYRQQNDSITWMLTGCLTPSLKYIPITRCSIYIILLKTHCKAKPCKAYREHPVSQFSQGKTCFHYREPLFSLQGPCFHYRDFPVNPCTSLLGIAVWNKLKLQKVSKSPHKTHFKTQCSRPEIDKAPHFLSLLKRLFGS